MLTWHGRVAGLWSVFIARALSFGYCLSASPTLRNRLSSLLPQHVITIVQHANRGKTVTCSPSSSSSSNSGDNRPERSMGVTLVHVSLENRIHLCDTLWQRIDNQRTITDVPSVGTGPGGSGGKGSGDDPPRSMSPSNR